MSDVLAFAGVGVVRGQSILLDDVNWDVEEGQRWVVLGPNGAGKTTLLQLASGRMHPSRGVVVTASYGIIGRWRESYDSLDHGRALQLLDALGAAHLVDRTYGTLSEGERKRVQIARSLMTDPELMLLDEPAAGLDLGGREDLVRRLGDIAGDLAAPALVLVTHHVEEIPPNFTDVLLLRDGRVVAQGPIEITLTEGNLSATFGLPLVLERHGMRYSARARS